MNIILCDDNSVQLEIMCNYVKDYLKQHKLEDTSELMCFTNADIVYDNIDDIQVDVAFLDVEMGDISGIDLSKVIREKFHDAIIVFVTGFTEHALTAFSVRALDYLVKPISKTNIETLLDEIVIIYNENIHKKFIKDNIKYFSFKKNRELIRLPYYEIVAFEKVNRKIRMFCLNGVYEYAGTFKTLKYELNMKDFLQCHQSYIINKEYIKEFSNPEIIVDAIGLKVPVNRSSKSVVKDILQSGWSKK